MISGDLRPRNSLSALVWLALFVPGHLFGGRLGLALPAAAVVLGATALLTSPSPWERRGPSRQAGVIFFLLFLLESVSTAYSAAFNGIRTGPLDVFGLARPLVAGLFTVYLIRHYDADVRKSLENALAAAMYTALFLLSVGARGRFLFEPVELMGYLASLAAIRFVFFSRAPLRWAHAAAAAAVVLFSAPPALGSLREALGYFWRSPVFGWGPAHYEPMSSLGNQYLRWLLRGGVLGAGLIFCGLGLVAFRLLRALWDDRNRLLGATFFLGFAAGMLLAGAFLEDFRLFALTGFLIADMHEEA